MIQKLRLQNFRNFEEKLFEFSPKVNIIFAPNASGKTNILESIFLIATAKSFHADLESEMINYSQDISQVKARVNTNEQMDLEVIILKLNGKSNKKFLLNNVSKRLIDFAGNFKAVLFGPWDMELVTDSPSGRRKFLDTTLSQIDYEYRRSLHSYEKGIRQRNQLLFRIREEEVPRSQLLFWDKLLIKDGNILTTKREEFVNFINNTHELGGKKFAIEYDRSAISEERLNKYANEEVAAATTLVGPHRDDILFKLEERELHKFGSRGEQRMSVLWLKLAELAFMEEKTYEKPTLLLDDIFSELDSANRELVMSVIAGQQTIVTTAEEHFIVDKGNVNEIKL